MQPQQPASSNPEPLPPSQFDFIMGGGQKPKSKLKLPVLNLPKPLKISLLVVAGLVVLLIFWSVLSGSKGSNAQPYISVAARAHEIARVSALVEQQATDPNTQALASTVQTTLMSEQGQITSYTQKHGTKISPSSLVSLQDKNADSQISTAVQNNNLPQVYSSYLKTNLAAYQTALQTAYKSAAASGKVILANAYSSVGVITKSANL